MFKFSYELKRVKRAVLEMQGNVQEYALNFLNIFNHVRASPSIFLKIENDNGNRVYVTFNPDQEESVVDYLEHFGTINKIQSVKLIDVFVDYRFEDFVTLYGDCDDVELLIDMD